MACTSARRADPAARARRAAGARTADGAAWPELDTRLRRAQRVVLGAAPAGRSAPHRRRADAGRHRQFEWSRPETLAAVPIPGRQRPLHRARSPSCTRRSPAAARSTARGCSPAARRWRAPPRCRPAHRPRRAVPDALAPRLPPRCHHRAARRRARFGHYGFGGSGAWADPDRQLAMAMVLNSGIGTPSRRSAHLPHRRPRPCAAPSAAARRGNSSASRAGAGNDAQDRVSRAAARASVLPVAVRRTAGRGRCVPVTTRTGALARATGTGGRRLHRELGRASACKPGVHAAGGARLTCRGDA